jgi:hypothetical protein
VLRLTNWYGDPDMWSEQSRGAIFTFLSFLNLQKYPPSLLYLMMALGPALMLLGYFQNAKTILADQLILFGRVPFFFYVVHVAFLHGLSILYFGLTIGTYNHNWQMNGPPNIPVGYEPSLIRCYLAFFFVTIVMYYLCRWFAGVKKRHDHWVLKYL